MKFNKSKNWVNSATTNANMKVIHLGSDINMKVAQAPMVPTTVPVCHSVLTPMSEWEIPYDQLDEEKKARVRFADELALYVDAAALPSGIALNDGSKRKPFQWKELWALHLVICFFCWKEKKYKLRMYMVSQVALKRWTVVRDMEGKWLENQD